LARTAKRIARLTIHSDLRDVAPERLPALDLARVFLGHSATHVVAAVPLEPAARILGVNAAFLLPHRERLAGLDAKIIALAIFLCGESLALANQLLGNSRLQSVIYLPPKTPSASICLGVSSGANSGSKPRPFHTSDIF
jgi:hypothetical protein